jgi:uncharacterized protein (DUF488 family)
VEIYTIGFTQTTAERFFKRLKEARIARVLDVRLNNSSQLSGFAKAQDLPFFLEQLVGVSYEHDPRLAPTQEILDEFKKRKGDWSTYEQQFMALMRERDVARNLDPAAFEQRTALLCSEATALHCHRRLVVEHLAESWPEVRAVHL